MSNIDEPIFGAELSHAEPNNMQNQDLEKRIGHLVHQQPFAVLCTQGEGQPYGSLIAYAFTDDLKQFFFTTPRATRKFKLLSLCSRVALFIDSRCQHPDDMTQVDAVTITGKATHLTAGDDFEKGLELLKNRHTYLESFLNSSSTALFRIDVVRYFHVTRFQEVCQWVP